MAKVQSALTSEVQPGRGPLHSYGQLAAPPAAPKPTIPTATVHSKAECTSDGRLSFHGIRGRLLSLLRSAETEGHSTVPCSVCDQHLPKNLWPVGYANVLPLLRDVGLEPYYDTALSVPALSVQISIQRLQALLSAAQPAAPPSAGTWAHPPVDYHSGGSQGAGQQMQGTWSNQGNVASTTGKVGHLPGQSTSTSRPQAGASGVYHQPGGPGPTGHGHGNAQQQHMGHGANDHWGTGQEYDVSSGPLTPLGEHAMHNTPDGRLTLLGVRTVLYSLLRRAHAEGRAVVATNQLEASMDVNSWPLGPCDINSLLLYAGLEPYCDRMFGCTAVHVQTAIRSIDAALHGQRQGQRQSGGAWEAPDRAQGGQFKHAPPFPSGPSGYGPHVQQLHPGHQVHRAQGPPMQHQQTRVAGLRDSRLEVPAGFSGFGKPSAPQLPSIRIMTELSAMPGPGPGSDPLANLAFGGFSRPKAHGSVHSSSASSGSFYPYDLPVLSGPLDDLSVTGASTVTGSRGAYSTGESAGSWSTNRSWQGANNQSAHNGSRHSRGGNLAAHVSGGKSGQTEHKNNPTNPCYTKDCRFSLFGLRVHLFGVLQQKLREGSETVLCVSLENCGLGSLLWPEGCHGLHDVLSFAGLGSYCHLTQDGPALAIRPALTALCNMENMSPDALAMHIPSTTSAHPEGRPSKNQLLRAVRRAIDTWRDEGIVYVDEAHFCRMFPSYMWPPQVVGGYLGLLTWLRVPTERTPDSDGVFLTTSAWTPGGKLTLNGFRKAIQRLIADKGVERMTRGEVEASVPPDVWPEGYTHERSQLQLILEATGFKYFPAASPDEEDLIGEPSGPREGHWASSEVPEEGQWHD